MSYECPNWHPGPVAWGHGRDQQYQPTWDDARAVARTLAIACLLRHRPRDRQATPGGTHVQRLRASRIQSARYPRGRGRGRDVQANDSDSGATARQMAGIRFTEAAPSDRLRKPLEDQ